MYKQASRLLARLLLGAAPMWAVAGINPFPQNPGFGEPSFSQEQMDAAYGSGRSTGRLEAAGECIGAPSVCGCVDGISPCGISLSSVLSGAFFGETEPNDHIVAADALIPEVLYWGQTPWLQDRVGDWHRDQDWFYITTQEPNQLLTLNFTVPDRVLLDSTRISQGWLISVRDAAGNVYAQFDTRFALDDPLTPNRNESKEIVYPVFLGHVGTYYVTVDPRIADSSGNLVTDPTGIPLNDLSVTFSPYNLAVVLEFSGMDGVPPDVNFHDVEIESNDIRDAANSLTSGVTMFGLLSQTTVLLNPVEPNNQSTSFVQTDVDWFFYDSPGLEQISLSWCGREDCKAVSTPEVSVDWFVEVTNEAGTPLVSFNTDKSETVHFGLPDAGRYYVMTTFHRSTDAECTEFSETETECKEASFGCMVLAVTPGAPETPGEGESTGTAATNPTCAYSPGNLCGTEPAGGTVPCARTDLGASAEAGPVTDNPIWYWGEGCSSFGYKCLAYGPTPDTNALSVEYNFTWWGTQLVPLTNGTDAFDAYLERPAWYQDR